MKAVPRSILLGALGTAVVGLCGCGASGRGVLLGFAIFDSMRLAAAAMDRNDAEEAAAVSSEPPAEPPVATARARTFPVAPPAEASRPDGVPGPFDPDAARALLSRVDLTKCDEAGLASGYWRARTTIDPSGAVIRVEVEGAAPITDDAERCVGEALVAVHLPAFRGTAATVTMRFYVP
jgi:hypothetical protein